jgi:hypothetical protein
MIGCSECGAFFFTIEGRKQHTGICIGYRPDEDSESKYLEAVARADRREQTEW